MSSQSPATEAGPPATPRTRTTHITHITHITHDRHGLRDALASIDSEGWKGSNRTALLECVRAEMVPALGIDRRLLAAAASWPEAACRETVASMARPTAHPNAYPKGSPSGHVRVYPGPASRRHDLHRHTRADLGGRVPGP
jgi:hypothetical protein